ncbi:MAG: Ig-like domain-containing protein [candidate division WOR-3 bacterium]|nr:Ig-like domain-containing protein [candidate division WOR-3 bacterium]MDW7987717.1 Ig-like domain-containing protein [candidate division WOR-3 bacterium]
MTKIVKCFVLLVFLFIGSCFNYERAPEVILTSPADGSYIRDSVKVYAEAIDNTEVRFVEFYIDSERLTVDSIYPYSFIWYPTISPGWHTIFAKAWDNKNNIALSNLVSVMIIDTTDTEPPLIGIISPAGWSTVSGNVLIRTQVSDNVGVSKVVFYIDGDSINTDLDAPFEYLWNTTGYADDYHSILAKAYDFGGNWANSLITVRVNNDTADHQPPQIAIVAPASWSTVSGTVLVRTEVSDDRGVSKVIFYVDGDSVAAVMNYPFNYLWNTTNLTNDYHTVLAKAYDHSGNWANSLITVRVNNQ